LPDENLRKKFAQYSTPPHIAEFMSKLLTDCGKLDLKDEIIYEPFVGAGAIFLPLRNKGAVLIGSDIDLEALNICKQLVPEAILIHHNSVGCLEPKENIRNYQQKIKQIKEKARQSDKDLKEIARLEERIEREKQRTPWR
jgi:tRNA G10  N-methylase Trm11